MSRSGGFRGCSNFSGHCHTANIHTCLGEFVRTANISVYIYNGEFVTCDKYTYTYTFVSPYFATKIVYIYIGEFVTCDKYMYIDILVNPCSATNMLMYIRWQVGDLRPKSVHMYISKFVSCNNYMCAYTLASS